MCRLSSTWRHYHQAGLLALSGTCLSVLSICLSTGLLLAAGLSYLRPEAWPVSRSWFLAKSNGIARNPHSDRQQRGPSRLQNHSGSMPQSERPPPARRLNISFCWRYTVSRSIYFCEHLLIVKLKVIGKQCQRCADLLQLVLIKVDQDGAFLYRNI